MLWGWRGGMTGGINWPFTLSLFTLENFWLSVVVWERLLPVGGRLTPRTPLRLWHTHTQKQICGLDSVSLWWNHQKLQKEARISTSMPNICACCVSGKHFWWYFVSSKSQATPDTSLKSDVGVWRGSGGAQTTSVGPDCNSTYFHSGSDGVYFQNIPIFTASHRSGRIF